ncbi:MAG: tRNA pseudouridine(13) synthase TruD [bacterium]|nr:tRNA pseudouridine(13) synthase TruD [bacterium]
MKIKYLPEDFYVEEIIQPKNFTKTKTNILLFKITKKNITTLKAVERIKLLTKSKVNFLGLKDKYSLSCQYITIKTHNPEKVIKTLEKYQDKTLKIEFIGFLQEELKLENLKKNKFKIILRDIDKMELDDYISNIDKILKIGYFLNYFDNQRINAKIILPNEIDRDTLKKKVDEMIENPDLIKIKKNLEKYSIKFNFTDKRENLIKESLLFNLSLCKKFIHQVESEKLNLKFKIYTKNNIILIPSLDEINQEEIQKLVILLSNLLEIKEQNTKRNFVSSIENILYEIEKDEFHKNRYKISMAFELNPGTYATILIKHIIPIRHLSHLKYRPLII